MTRKQDEIYQLLVEGASPAELVHRGYSRGTVYKVHSNLGKGVPATPLTPSSAATGSSVDQNLESDPDIMELKKAVRKAELEKQLAETIVPLDLEERLNTLEEGVEELSLMMDEAAAAYSQPKTKLTAVGL